MEMNTIIGIVAAVVIMLVGLIMILRKPKPVEPSLEADLHINPESQQPVIPRHVRDQILQNDVVTAATDRVEPSFKTAPIEAEPLVETPVQAVAVEEKTEETISEDTVVEPTVQVETSTESEVVTSEPQVEDATAALENPEKTEENEVEESGTEESKAESELSLNPNIETVEIAEFDGESNILDVHLHEQQRYDDESALATAEQIIALNVYPNPRRALSGDKALKVLLKYGLRFGEMSCFHRYENTDEPSALMFSVLRVTDNGPAGFDLETLSAEQVQGLAFFLALPNSKAVTGYDMMTSIAGLIAREIDGKVYDENNLEFTPQLKEHWRHHVIDYRPNQATV
ncbi:MULTISPECIES: cell division protein ZipA C-terminal FtsZ-binding domain-containing protein [unclassified Acinetobacter]|uniref:cell division protein ZipA C-terminal FtsZ-binding domain-containing protein n=1 Tax=unclassified Acinetobacter TaxID=196816 RepID=UPI00244918E5|nr:MULTISPECIES: cell division protein ZipA C-terminal FtsZ-binding domain-containing protein [unclassified Acinetobacter]MDH0030795.1 cell division protein ZipA [Acinetobacter sp. GD04021]MDH0886432.1 cell division protein ZipA [Acinetobacter sp. GD03873]MDH1082818.1 cell division protein ZipA [Acinetobacter sp. GD03983]MDH2189844.1 cell division protein ZipA [Acinetobacter sp. GD03645]MDH2202997.1 cell division protein ZipA [Acinetobacter sp. GD03647]